MDRIKRTTIYILSLITILLGAGIFVIPPRDYSEAENRYLQEVPEVSVSNILDRTFMEEEEAYVNDHLPFRDRLFSAAAAFLRLQGRRKIDDVYLAGYGFLIQDYAEPENTEKFINQVLKLSENLESADICLELVPTAITAYSFLLPDKSPALQTDAPMQAATISEVYDAVSGRDNITTAHAAGLLLWGGVSEGDLGLYYRTDHHWTTRGAFLGYQAYCAAVGLPVPDTAPELKTVTDDFRGTLFSRTGDLSVGTDSIQIYDPAERKLTLTYTDTGEVTDSLYNMEYLDKRDKYSMFLNNIHPLVIIENDDAATSEELAIVKDSYANAMIPFLADDYKKIYVYDTRYFKGGVSKDINSHKDVSHVLVLYNLNTMDEDRGIGGIY